VFLLLGLSIALWLALRAFHVPSRAAGILVLVELAQGLIGFAQYFSHLPIWLVGAHLAGACSVWVATLAVWYSLRQPNEHSSPLTKNGMIRPRQDLTDSLRP
jgi:cytochrome c oxidase assembly protein subunit 15